MYAPRPTSPLDLPPLPARAARLVLDQAADLLARDAIEEGLDLLATGLAQVRLDAAPEDWLDTVQNLCRPHPIGRILLEEPIIRRVATRGRGAGLDADTLDLLLGLAESQPQRLPPGTTPRGRALHSALVRDGWGRLQRVRLGQVVSAVDAAADRRVGADVLTVGAAHLREARLCRALREVRIGRWVALNEDAAATRAVQVDVGPYGVEARVMSLSALMGEPPPLGRFDLICCASALDGLGDPLARELLCTLYALLRPGGTLLLGSLRPEFTYAAFLEAFLDLWFVYRDEPRLKRLLDALPTRGVASMRLFRDEPVAQTWMEVEAGPGRG